MNPHHIRLSKLTLIFVISLMFIPMQEGISASVTSVEDSVIIIANPDVFESALSAKDIRDIFLGKKRKWTDGKEIILAVMYQADIHKTFTTKYTKKTPAQFLTYWKHMVFVGQGRFPKAFSTEAEMVNYIEKSSGAIGYVSQKPPMRKKVKLITLSD